MHKISHTKIMLQHFVQLEYGEKKIIYYKFNKYIYISAQTALMQTVFTYGNHWVILIGNNIYVNMIDVNTAHNIQTFVFRLSTETSYL